MGYSASYRRLPRLLTELAIARADGRYAKLLASLAKTSVLVIDDWGVSKLSTENRRDLLEIIEDRHGLRSTIVTSQLPVEKWHAVIGDPTLTAKLNDVDPQAWLADVLSRIAELPHTRVHELLPWNWKAARDQALAA